jgi:hypothetical protein
MGASAPYASSKPLVIETLALDPPDLVSCSSIWRQPDCAIPTSRLSTHRHRPSAVPRRAERRSGGAGLDLSVGGPDRGDRHAGHFVPRPMRRRQAGGRTPSSSFRRCHIPSGWGRRGNRGQRGGGPRTRTGSAPPLQVIMREQHGERVPPLAQGHWLVSLPRASRYRRSGRPGLPYRSDTWALPWETKNSR